MEITGKVHCFFEQSGTFKNEFIKLGIPAEDYDIQNNFGETDHVVDLFTEIEKAYDCRRSIFDNIRGGGFDNGVFPLYLFLRCQVSILARCSYIGEELVSQEKGRASYARVRL